ncbi:hypothetical protein L9F63_004882 [Diploptera punctata]|uniref:Uncharacterized protein n=1 Tax=Diploptera punctata TaxID=6984 RepID=A0AAD7ZE41_DIPPU|nr:hypothetical protein L9F63_004882 [Diploptera punctata]
MANEKYLTEEELVSILYNDDSGDDLIPELEDSQSESEDEHPLPEIDTPISCKSITQVISPSNPTRISPLGMYKI